MTVITLTFGYTVRKHG